MVVKPMLSLPAQDAHFWTLQVWLDGGSGDGEIVLSYPVGPMLSQACLQVEEGNRVSVCVHAQSRSTFLRPHGPGGLEGKASACNAEDPGSIPGSGRSPEEGNGNPLQYSCLENPMDRGACWATVHGVAKSQTRLSWPEVTKPAKLSFNFRKPSVSYIRKHQSSTPWNRKLCSSNKAVNS